MIRFSPTGCAASIRAAAVILLAWAVLFLCAPEQLPGKPAEKKDDSRFIDLSLLVAPEYPCTWPTFPTFQINHYKKIGRLGAFNSDILILDGNTGTQLDVPPHSVTPPASRLPNPGPFCPPSTHKIPPR